MCCSSLFVSNRLKSLTLLPELLPWVHYGTSITCVFGMGTGVSPLRCARVDEAACESIDTTPPLSYCSTAIHPDVLNIAGLAVSFAVGVGSPARLMILGQYMEPKRFVDPLQQLAK